MSRKVLLETGYTFTPGDSGVGQLVIPKAILRERLILITNVTTNTVIYNFSDANLKATTYTLSSSANTTTLVFNSITSGMSSTDKLQIIVDEYDEKFTPSETYTDPVNKFRVSTAQALIDTDFEYGTQISKWENLTTINNRPFSFASATGLVVTAIGLPTSSRTVTVTVSAGLPAIGTPITVQDCYLNIANGNFIVETHPDGSGGFRFTYTARAVNTSTVTDIFDPNKTIIYSGSVYSGAAIGGTPTFSWTSGTAIPVSTAPVAHGLAIGNEVAITGTSQASANGSFVVATITSSTSFVYYALTAPSANPTGGTIYVRPQGQVLHRPFDGGVIFSSNANGNYETTTRQTRRYFRYQSGKGIQVSSGTIIKPNLQIDSLTSSGTTVTIQTKEQHNILPGVPGTVVAISGANESAYNGSFAITSVTGYNTFQYTALSAPSATTASGSYSASVTGWYGAANRLGIFDAQNGIFFEFDGQTLYAVRRSSTYQISGKVTATNGSSVISRTDNSFPTSFTKQLNMGDFIVIRGQSYRVTDIASDSSLTISPAYRGATTSFAIVSRTVELRIPQSQWNIDKCDGTGPSGYNIDLSKMQMFYMDYSWYGAGFIRWGFRGPNGDVIYVHKLANNNVNTEAYMRSGNLPARYESTSEPPKTQLRATLTSGATTVSVASTVGFPTSGTMLIRNANVYEYMNYSGISGSGTNGTFTGLTRARAGVTGLTITINAASNTGTATTTGIQIGQRVVNTNAFPEGTFVTAIGTGTLTFSQAALSANPTGVTIAPMGATSGQSFTFSEGDPVAIEFAYPTYGPTISHWGTSVIMDGRFDDDKSLVFTFGQTASTNIAQGTSRALFSIRVSPSVDNGVSAVFGARELINRMQLTLRALDITTSTANANLLVTAVLNGTPSSSTTWTNAVANVLGVINSSLAQIASYAGGSTTVSGGEVTAGFFVGSGANSIDLSQVRDLGNSILGGGGSTSNTQIYPDGPDTLAIVVQNLSLTTPESVFGRLSWTEAQA
jgi:hypothetical protein